MLQELSFGLFTWQFFIGVCFGVGIGALGVFIPVAVSMSRDMDRLNNAVDFDGAACQVPRAGENLEAIKGVVPAVPHAGKQDVA